MEPYQKCFHNFPAKMRKCSEMLAVHGAIFRDIGNASMRRKLLQAVESQRGFPDFIGTKDEMDSVNVAKCWGRCCAITAKIRNRHSTNHVSSEEMKTRTPRKIGQSFGNPRNNFTPFQFRHVPKTAG
ncbi:unnamed protein product, partial [Notodromas monacha]